MLGVAMVHATWIMKTPWVLPATSGFLKVKNMFPPFKKNRLFRHKTGQKIVSRWWFQKTFLFLPLLGEMIQFD